MSVCKRSFIKLKHALLPHQKYYKIMYEWIIVNTYNIKLYPKLKTKMIYTYIDLCTFFPKLLTRLKLDLYNRYRYIIT